MASDHCSNQGFVIGPNLGMQCHVEMTERLIDTWCLSGQSEIDTSPGPAVQQPEVMRQGIGQKVQDLHAVATRLYDRWTQGLRR
jgi:GMP synthase-like glutamine amidotransferase